MDAFNATPVWQMYNLPAPSSGGIPVDDGGQSQGQGPQMKKGLIGGALDSVLKSYTGGLLGNQTGQSMSTGQSSGSGTKPSLWTQFTDSLTNELNQGQF